MEQFTCMVWLQEERATPFPMLLVSLSIKRRWMWFQIPADQGNWIPVYHLTAGLQENRCHHVGFGKDSRVKPRCSWNGSAISVVRSSIQFAARTLLCSSCSSWRLLWAVLLSWGNEHCASGDLLSTFATVQFRANNFIFTCSLFPLFNSYSVNAFTEYLEI